MIEKFRRFFFSIAGLSCFNEALSAHINQLVCRANYNFSTYKDFFNDFHIGKYFHFLFNLFYMQLNEFIHLIDYIDIFG